MRLNAAARKRDAVSAAPGRPQASSHRSQHGDAILVGATAAATIDDYIATFPKHVQLRLQRVRRVIAKAAPQALEAISYRIPTFKLNGINLIYFAGFKAHIGMYPIHADGAEFGPEIARYASGKASLRFPHDEPLPIRLISEIVKSKLRKASASRKRASEV